MNKRGGEGGGRKQWSLDGLESMGIDRRVSTNGAKKCVAMQPNIIR